MSISADSILTRGRRPGNAGRHRDDGRPHGTCWRGLRSREHGHAVRRSLRILTGRAAGGRRLGHEAGAGAGACPSPGLVEL